MTTQTQTAQKNMLINANICTGCRLCELICSLYKEKETNPAKARIHNEFYLMEGMRVPRVCINCDDPKCIPACPIDALNKDKATGWVVMDTKLCNDCQMCIGACPYGAIRVTPDNDVIKCDLCGGEPQCVTMCETKAIKFDSRLPQKITLARQGMKSFLDKEITEK